MSLPKLGVVTVPFNATAAIFTCRESLLAARGGVSWALKHSGEKPPQALITSSFSPLPSMALSDDRAFR